MNVLILVTYCALHPWSLKSDYDPLTTTGSVSIVDAKFQYGERQREVPLRIFLPQASKKAPVVLFSHGLGGSRENNPYLGNHWSKRGYAVVFIQHAGSDENVWRNVPQRDRLKRLKAAADGNSFKDRTKDVPATLDQLKKWNQTGGKFAQRFDLERIGMSGHSFGAVTTQAVSGQNYGRRGQLFTDSRIKAALAMSPSVPAIGNNDETFKDVKIPWMLMTGTQDKSIISRTTPEDRQKVFQQLPQKGNFYELVLFDAEHMAFSERKLTGGKHRNPNHHKAILALSTAFWDCYLRGDESAKKWLAGSSAEKLLEPKDVFRRK